MYCCVLLRLRYKNECSILALEMKNQQYFYCSYEYLISKSINHDKFDELDV